jgi:predicted glycosyltransferase
LINLKKILIAPLDWGLGHTSRCIPIIKYLQQKNIQVIVACNTAQQTLLEQEVSNIRYTYLPGYNISYGTTSISTTAKLIMQIPSILNSIKKEQEWLKQFVLSEPVDAVISDNRYGFYHKEVYSICITHQLNVKGPFGLSIGHYSLQYFLKQFDAIWVPDNKQNIKLSGLLGHPKKSSKLPIQYIGWLSRFEQAVPFIGQNKNSILIILSGPEPQKSILMHKLLALFKNTNYALTIIGASQVVQQPNAQVFNIVSSQQLLYFVANNNYIITRSGYTTLMELAFWQRPAILIPTPAQTEQVYLAKYITQQGYHTYIEQNNLQLSKLEQSLQLLQALPTQAMVYKKFVDDLLLHI